MAKVKEANGILFIVSAPSGAGKTTLCRMAVDYFSDLRHSISYTTRSPREGEKNGVDYHFVSELIFQKMLDNSEFLEWARVHGNKYGTSVKDTQAILEKGLDIILDIDVQGAKKIKNIHKDSVAIFVLPPSIDELKNRLLNRRSNSLAEMEKRLRVASEEIRNSIFYDYVVINDNIQNAVEKIKSIVVAEKHTQNRMRSIISQKYIRKL